MSNRSSPKKVTIVLLIFPGQNIGGKQETDIYARCCWAVFSKWTADVLCAYIVTFKVRPAHTAQPIYSSLSLSLSVQDIITYGLLFRPSIYSILCVPYIRSLNGERMDEGEKASSYFFEHLQRTLSPFFPRPITTSMMYNKVEDLYGQLTKVSLCSTCQLSARPLAPVLTVTRACL